MIKTFISVLIFFFGIYIAICSYFFIIQNSILFNPTVLEKGHQFNYDFEFEERWFLVGDEARIHAIHARADSSKGLVIFYHGNGGNTDTDPEKFNLFLDNGYDVLYPDYRSYGLTEGDLWNEEDLVGDMKIVYKSMMMEYDQENIIVLGYSLGSGVAAQVAAVYDPKQVIIWTPYYSVMDLKDAEYWFIPDFLVRYPLRTDLAIQEIEEPIIIFYASEDKQLPIESAIRLNEFLDENDEYFILEGQGHNKIYYNQELKEKISEILSRN